MSYDVNEEVYLQVRTYLQNLSDYAQLVLESDSVTPDDAADFIMTDEDTADASANVSARRPPANRKPSSTSLHESHRTGRAKSNSRKGVTLASSTTQSRGARATATNISGTALMDFERSAIDAAIAQATSMSTLSPNSDVTKDSEDDIFEPGRGVFPARHSHLGQRGNEVKYRLRPRVAADSLNAVAGPSGTSRSEDRNSSGHNPFISRPAHSSPWSATALKPPDSDSSTLAPATIDKLPQDVSQASVLNGQSSGNDAVIPTDTAIIEANQANLPARTSTTVSSFFRSYDDPKSHGVTDSPSRAPYPFDEHAPPSSFKDELFQIEPDGEAEGKDTRDLSNNIVLSKGTTSKGKRKASRLYDSIEIGNSPKFTGSTVLRSGKQLKMVKVEGLSHTKRRRKVAEGLSFTKSKRNVTQYRP